MDLIHHHLNLEVFKGAVETHMEIQEQFVPFKHKNERELKTWWFL